MFNLCVLRASAILARPRPSCPVAGVEATKLSKNPPHGFKLAPDILFRLIILVFYVYGTSLCSLNENLLSTTFCFRAKQVGLLSHISNASIDCVCEEGDE